MLSEKVMKLIFLTVVLAACAICASATESPYAGQQHRHIKSLSAQEIQALRNGEGMGFAKLAELNRFPGPRHVLDLAQELALTPEQLEQTQSIFDAMQSSAKRLGRELLAAEADLDRAFANDAIDADTLRDALLHIGELRARLRFVHLDAHLQQKNLLTDAQIDSYDRHRGYDRNGAEHSGHSKHH